MNQALEFLREAVKLCKNRPSQRNLWVRIQGQGTKAGDRSTIGVPNTLAEACFSCIR